MLIDFKAPKHLQNTISSKYSVQHYHRSLEKFSKSSNLVFPSFGLLLLKMFILIKKFKSASKVKQQVIFNVERAQRSNFIRREFHADGHSRYDLE